VISGGGTRAPNPLIGSYVPFAATREERERTGDPRGSIAERYANRDAYRARIEEAASNLVRAGYLLGEDVPAIEARALEHWSLATATAASTATH
jgi:hypothetical protein